MSRSHSGNSGTFTIHLASEGRRRGAAVSAGEVVLNHVRAMEEDPEMNLYRIGDTILNMDRVNGIQDHQAPSDPKSPAGQTVIRVLFDDTTIEIAGAEAQIFRRWYRHNTRDLAPRKDESGEELISPEEQVRAVSAHLRSLVDRLRPRDTTLRHNAHRLAEMIETYITGELQPARSTDFEKSLEVARAEAHIIPDAPS